MPGAWATVSCAHPPTFQLCSPRSGGLAPHVHSLEAGKALW